MMITDQLGKHEAPSSMLNVILIAALILLRQSIFENGGNMTKHRGCPLKRTKTQLRVGAYLKVQVLK